MSRVYNKLVRDKIPEIIAADGLKAKTRILDEKEFLKELTKKLKEEIDELADIKEVTNAIREAMKIHAGELEDLRRKRAAERGRFKNKFFLESVE